MGYPKDDHLMGLFINPVQNAIGAATSAPDSFELSS